LKYLKKKRVEKEKNQQEKMFMDYNREETKGPDV